MIHELIQKETVVFLKAYQIQECRKTDHKYAIKGLFTTLLLVNIFKNIGLLAILVISSALLLISISPFQNSYGQISGGSDTNQLNQTSIQNNTNQTQQQLEQANQQLAQANQTQEQVSNQTQQPDSKMIEKLLNFTNTAILALNEDDISVAEDNLGQIQNTLINASGKQVVIVPAPAVSTSDEDTD